MKWFWIEAQVLAVPGEKGIFSGPMQGQSEESLREGAVKVGMEVKSVRLMPQEEVDKMMAEVERSIEILGGR